MSLQILFKEFLKEISQFNLIICHRFRHILHASRIYQSSKTVFAIFALITMPFEDKTAPWATTTPVAQLAQLCLVCHCPSTNTRIDLHGDLNVKMATRPTGQFSNAEPLRDGPCGNSWLHAHRNASCNLRLVAFVGHLFGQS